MKSDKFNEWLKGQLRRVHHKWIPRTEAKKNAKVSYGKYKCAYCGELFGPRDIAIDHINPVIDPNDGFIDWNTYIDRLFLSMPEYQILCKECHIKKTNDENVTRRAVKLLKE